jgi:UDP-GlcNAc3NAcA epimerase
MHPRTTKALQNHELSLPENVTHRDPVSYFEMLGLLENCTFVLTDSGGLQKEAYVLEKPCITLRNQTEWTELVEAGVNRVVGADTALIVEAMKWAETEISFNPSLYGGGKSAHQIVELLHTWL